MNWCVLAVLDGVLLAVAGVASWAHARRNFHEARDSDAVGRS